MPRPRALFAASLAALLLPVCVHSATSAKQPAGQVPLPAPLEAAFSPATWRTERRLVDVHLHIESLPERF